ncbi:beta-ketoacyl synthase N-terminal-like domain-containing protein [Lachnospiraceae bacterium 54-53]
MGKRVAITGIGVSICNHGLNGEDELKAFKNRKIKKLLSGGEKFFCSSAISAVHDSGILDAHTAKEKRGIFLGTTKESSSRMELLNVLKSIYDGEIRYPEFPEAVVGNMSPLFVVKSLPNACLHYGAEEFDIRGSNSLFITNGAAGSQAIAAAYHSVKREDCIWCLAGGFDSHMEEDEFYNYEQYGFKIADSPDEKSSKTLSEGAGSLIVEDYDHAVSRKAKIYGEIIGHGEVFLDLENNQEENAVILKRGILKSLAMANKNAEEIDFIHTDGLAYRNYNEMEEKAVQDIFSDTPRIDLKKRFGNLMGAASVVEIAADLNTGLRPGIALETFMKISAGFGGEVSIMIIRRNEL